MGPDLLRWKQSQEHEIGVYENREDPWPKEATQRRLGQFGKKLGDLYGARILEIGSGMGMIHSLDINCEPIGLDPLTHHNREKLAGSHAQLITGIGEKLPFEDDSMDIVLSYNVLDHCIEPGKVLEEVQRVLTQEGEFLLEVNTYEVPKFVRKLLVDRLDQEHPHHFSSNVLKSMLRSRNFRIDYEQTEDMYDLLSVPNLRRIGGVLFRIRRYFVVASLNPGAV